MVKGLCLSRMVKGKRALTKTHGFTQKSRAHKQKRRKKRDHRCRATKAKLTYKKRHSSKPLFFFLKVITSTGIKKQKEKKTLATSISKKKTLQASIGSHPEICAEKRLKKKNSYETESERERE